MYGAIAKLGRQAWGRSAALAQLFVQLNKSRGVRKAFIDANYHLALPRCLKEYCLMIWDRAPAVLYVSTQILTLSHSSIIAGTFFIQSNYSLSYSIEEISEVNPIILLDPTFLRQILSKSKSPALSDIEYASNGHRHALFLGDKVMQ